MSKVSFMAECEEDVMRSVTDHCAKYGVTFTSVLEKVLTDYMAGNPGSQLTAVAKDVKVFLGDLRPPKDGVVLPVANDPF